MGRKRWIEFWKNQEDDILLAVPHYEPLRKTSSVRKDSGWEN